MPKLSVKKFLSSYFLKKHYVGKTGLPQLPKISVDRLVEIAREKNHPEVVFQAWGDISQKDFIIPVDKVLKIYQSTPATVVVRGVEHLIPQVAELLDKLERETGTLTRRKNCLAFFSTKGKRSLMHYDGGENFTIHLSGKKRWKIAPNREAHPPSSYTVGSEIVPADLKKMVSRFPKKMPKDHAQVDMRAGSVMYLPQGFWHETVTLEDSAHLTFCLFTKSWSDLILDRLKEVHLSHAAWRAPAVGVLAEGEARSKANKHFERLWGKLAQELFFDQ